MKVARRLGVVLLVSLLGYVIVCLVLIYWPIPGKKDAKNYDFSSIQDSASDVGRGHKQSVPMRDGRQLFLRVYESDSPDTLLLLHGSGSESRYLSKLATWLSAHGVFRVVTPDLRGHGRNEGPRGDIEYLGQLDDDIEDVMHWLEKTRPGTHVVLGGHSSGGGLALRYAGNHAVMQPEALLLLAPYLGHTSPTVKPSSGDWVTVAVKRWVGISMLNNLRIPAFNDLPVLFFNRPASVDDALQVDAYSWRMAVNFAPRDYEEDIKALKVPTFVLVGEKDESFYPEQFAPVFEAASDHASVRVVRDANHLDIVDSPASIERIVTWKKEWLIRRQDEEIGGTRSRPEDAPLARRNRGQTTIYQRRPPAAFLNPPSLHNHPRARHPHPTGTQADRGEIGDRPRFIKAASRPPFSFLPHQAFIHVSRHPPVNGTDERAKAAE